MDGIFAAFGMGMDAPATAKTPQRFIRALYDIASGYEGAPNFAGGVRDGAPRRARLRVEPDHRGVNPVLQSLRAPRLPFFGRAYIGYIAHERIILTLAPQVAGRDSSRYRPGFAGGALFAPERPHWDATRRAPRVEPSRPTLRLRSRMKRARIASAEVDCDQRELSGSQRKGAAWLYGYEED